jgi:hypothetical protein
MASGAVELSGTKEKAQVSPTQPVLVNWDSADAEVNLHQKAGPKALEEGLIMEVPHGNPEDNPCSSADKMAEYLASKGRALKEPFKKILNIYLTGEDPAQNTQNLPLGVWKHFQKKASPSIMVNAAEVMELEPFKTSQGVYKDMAETPEVQYAPITGRGLELKVSNTDLGDDKQFHSTLIINALKPVSAENFNKPSSSTLEYPAWSGLRKASRFRP